MDFDFKNYQPGNQGNVNSYSVDLVICIDGTGSMRDRIEKTKQDAINFYAMFIDAMDRGTKTVREDAFRVKVIVFRDYKDDDFPAMEESRFFSIADAGEKAQFEDFVNAITADGGGDAPENALEAIYLAITNSDWVRRGGRYRRHAIMLFTDAPALPLNHPERVGKNGYPMNAPADLHALEELFKNGDQMCSFSPYNGRLIVFAPRGCDWEIINTWENTFFTPVKPGGGCDEVDMEEALNVLVSSL